MVTSNAVAIYKKSSSIEEVCLKSGKWNDKGSKDTRSTVSTPTPQPLNWLTGDKEQCVISRHSFLWIIQFRWTVFCKNLNTNHTLGSLNTMQSYENQPHFVWIYWIWNKAEWMTRWGKMKTFSNQWRYSNTSL